MTFDQSTNRFVLFGGRDENWDIVNETWTFESASGTWERVETASAPSPRFMHAMAYDPNRRRVILYGGTDGDDSLGDLWVFETATATWTELSDDGPPSRMLHGMVFESHRDRLVVFGGRYQRAGRPRQLGDTWAFDFESNSWFEFSPDQSPSDRDHPAMAYDESAERIILFGGERGSAVVGDTWSFSDGQWREQNPTAAPIARAHGLLLYVRAFGGVLLVGGSFEDDRIFRYVHSTNRWQVLPLSGEVLPNGDHMAGATDGRAILIQGGFPRPSDETWLLAPR